MNDGFIHSVNTSTKYLVVESLTDSAVNQVIAEHLRILNLKATLKCSYKNRQRQLGRESEVKLHEAGASTTVTSDVKIINGLPAKIL